MTFFDASFGHINMPRSLVICFYFLNNNKGGGLRLLGHPLKFSERGVGCVSAAESRTTADSSASWQQ